MNSAREIQAFIGQKVLAMVGVSRNQAAFSFKVFQDLQKKGYKVFPINPHAEKIADAVCYPSLAKLPEKVGGVLIFTPASETKKIVQEAQRLQINLIWIQQGAENAEAEAFCREQGLQVVSGKCIYMFAEPVNSFHAIHRFFAKLFGQIPK
jgi:predicted CoA-binding protein